MWKVADDKLTIFKLASCAFSQRAAEHAAAVLPPKLLDIVDIAADEKTPFSEWFHREFASNPIIAAHDTFPVVFWRGDFVGGCDDLIEFLRR